MYCIFQRLRIIFDFLDSNPNPDFLGTKKEMPEQIEPAALDSDLCQLAAFGMLDGLKKLL